MKPTNNFYRLIDAENHGITDAVEKLHAGEIMIGAPVINKGQMLSLERGRYYIHEPKSLEEEFMSGVTYPIQ